MEGPSSPCCKMWSEAPVLMNRAAIGRMCLVTNPKAVDRKDVVANADVIIPILKFCGTRVTVDIITDHVEIFFHFARPKGKATLPRHLFEFITRYIFDLGSVVYIPHK